MDTSMGEIVTERDEQNRKVAEWLGWRYKEWTELDQDGSQKCCKWEKPVGCKLKWDYNYLPDFRTDEAANAMVLEKMLSLGFMLEMWPQAADLRLIVIFRKVIGPNSGPVLEEYGRGHLQLDRNTAIFLDALAYIDSLR